MGNYVIVERGTNRLMVPEVPPELVEALQGATPEQMQEAADLVTCARAGIELLECNRFSGIAQDWSARLHGAQEVVGSSRASVLHELAEALRALAEAVKGETP